MKQLYRKGANIVMACRSMERMNQAQQNVENEIKDTDGVIECIKLDLSSQQSVQEFVDEYKQKHENDKLNVLVNNAGIMAIKNLERSVDGYELQMAANHFGHFALTLKLLPYMASDARIISLSSSMQAMGNLWWDMNDINWNTRTYSAWGAYGQVKLANVLFIKGLQKRLNASEQGKHILAFSVDPGSIPSTGITRNSQGSWGTVMQKAMFFTHKTIQQGAATSVNCITNPTLTGENGGNYFADCNPKCPNAKANDESEIQKLWEQSETLTKTTFPF